MSFATRLTHLRRDLQEASLTIACVGATVLIAAAVCGAQPRDPGVRSGSPGAGSSLTGLTAAQLAAFRTAEPDTDEEELTEDVEDRLQAVDEFALDAPGLVTDLDDEDDEILPDMDEDEE